MNECSGKYFVENGKVKETTGFDDAFLQTPHYIYEVFRVIDGTALFLEDHLHRLEKTCALSEHCPGFSHQQIHHQVYQLIRINHFNYGNIKIVLTSQKPGVSKLIIYINPHQYPTPEQYKKGVAVSLYKGVRYNPNAKVMDVKLRANTNMVKQEKNVYETLLVDEKGFITEGSRSNVFFIKNRQIITPPLKDVLPGITRKHIIQLCQQMGLDAREEKVKAQSLEDMEGLFITGTSRKVLPVNQVDQWLFDPQQLLTQRISQAFDHKTREYIKARQSSANP